MGKNTSPTSPVKLSLLLCDTPVPAVLDTYGTYLDIFRNQLLLSNPNHPAPFPFTLDGYDVVNKQEYPDLEEGGYTGVLISGSKYNAHGEDAWIEKLVAWVRETAEKRKDIKLIGICFGHQIIARALGGSCVPNNGHWEVGTTDVELTDIGKAVFRSEKPTIAIQQMHRDHVPSVPPSFQLLGSSPICPVQGLVRLYSTDTTTSPPPSANPADATWDASTIQILTVQGHPEFTAPIVSAIIDVREASGAMSAEVVREGRARAVREHEGIGSIGRAIWRVLGVDAKP